jgi:hypothetical protein
MASSNSIWAPKSNSKKTQNSETTHTFPIGSTFRLSSVANVNATSPHLTAVKPILSQPKTVTATKLKELNQQPCTNSKTVPESNSEFEYSMEQSMEYSLLGHEDLEADIDWMDVDVIDPAELARIDTMVQELRSDSVLTIKPLQSKLILASIVYKQIYHISSKW